MRRRRKFRRFSLYKKSLIIYVFALLILAEAFLIYVSTSLKAYENGDIKNYMDGLISDISSSAKKGNADKYFAYPEVVSEYEKASFKNGYKQLFKDAKITYEKDTDNTYILYADDIKVAKIVLDDKNVKTKLGLLTYTDYKIKEINAYNEKGIYELDFYLTSNYNLYINGKKASNQDIIETTPISEYEEVYDLVDLPSLNHYKIDNLTKKPEIKVEDSEGKIVDYKIVDGSYYATNYFQTDEENKAMEMLEHEFDSLEFAKKWSLFLTNDLTGARHGLYQLTPNLIEGTQMYQRAYNWATQVDITFTSFHTLDKDTFTNPSLKNFTVYNKNAFSVEVYFEKNMTLSDGQKRQDVLHDIFYYVYIDGAYRLVHMKAVTEGE